MTETTVLLPGQPVNRHGTYIVQQQVPDEAAARRFLAEVRERLDTHRRMAAAVAEYEVRVERNEPYEGGLTADEIRERYGV